ncbi:MAG: D-alanyl-D-alanine carboxypeptidase family protein [Nitrospirota bacterium]
MKFLRRSVVLVLPALLVLALASSGMAQDDDMGITAKGAVVMDADTGKVIISRSPDYKLPPASTTKVMTAIITLEKARLTDTFRVSRTAADTAPSKVYLRPGDQVTVEALLYAVLLKSANDGAVTLAEGIAGSEDAFARMMTEKAHEIGALNTHFSNASGLPADDHYTTAMDLALILRYAMHDPRFMEIASTKFATLNMGAKEKMLLKNHNRLLWFYDGAGAGKTGYTVAARHCYVGEANCSNTRLIVAVLHSRDLWNDTRKLLDKGFQLAMAGQTLALADSPEEILKVNYVRHHHVVRVRRRHHRKRRNIRTY